MLEKVEHIEMRARHLFTALAICILAIPPLTEGISLNLSDVRRELAETIWEEVDHDFVIDDVMAFDIKFKNVTHGWALSQNKTSFGDGIILHTTDSGYSWQIQLYNNSTWFPRMEIVGNNMWVTADGGLFHSVNDGESWYYIPIGSESNHFYGLFFFNETLGWASSERGLYKTIDGGMIWNETLSYPYDDRARDICFTSPEDGWIINTFGIYHTVDGGETWEKSHSKGGWAFSFVSDTEAWAVGDDMLAHMVDGKTWIEQSLPNSAYGQSPYFTDIQFLNQTHGWIGGKTPLIAHSQNSGVDWYEQSVPTEERIEAIFMLNASLGWAISWGGHILRTTRGKEIGVYSWSTASNLGPVVIFLVIIIAIGVSVILYRIRKRRYLVSHQQQSQDGEMT